MLPVLNKMYQWWLNKMYQWWLGTAPSGLELAGEADSPAKVQVQGVTSYSLRNLALNLV